MGSLSMAAWIRNLRVRLRTQHMDSFSATASASEQLISAAAPELTSIIAPADGAYPASATPGQPAVSRHYAGRLPPPSRDDDIRYGAPVLVKTYREPPALSPGPYPRSVSRDYRRQLPVADHACARTAWLRVIARQSRG